MFQKKFKVSTGVSSVGLAKLRCLSSYHKNLLLFQILLNCLSKIHSGSFLLGFYLVYNDLYLDF
jgi:hypothetical protein